MSSFRKAVRTARKLRMSIQGPAGSGKTRTALELLTRIAKRVAVLDTEHSSADTYAPLPGAQSDAAAGTFDFDACPMDPPYTPQAYIDKMHEAAREGYDGLVIDSLSHAWMGDGGILSMADKKGGRFDAWKELTPIQNKLMAAVLSYPGHIVVTMRTQTAYEVTKDERTGKSKPEKIGTKPVQKEGTEYEFDIVIDIDPEHVGHVTKTRCSEIEGLSIQRPGAPLAMTIKRWLDAGEGEPLAPKAPAEKSADRLGREANLSKGVAILRGLTADGATEEVLAEIGKLATALENVPNLSDADLSATTRALSAVIAKIKAQPKPPAGPPSEAPKPAAPPAPEKPPATVHPISPACESLLATIRTSLDVIVHDFPKFAEQARRIVAERPIESMPEVGLRAVKLALDAVYAQAVAA